MTSLLKTYYCSSDDDFTLYKGDCRVLIPQLPISKFDMIFADPPYFLSNGGFSVQAGKRVCVDKGKWDKSQGLKADADFTFEWLNACRAKLSDSGTIWVCGTFHNIFTVASVLSELNFKILNSIVWQKSNPPPNLSCRFFTHSTEFVVWARKSPKVAHYYNYDLMHKIAGDRQMTDVWRMPAIAPWEKSCGKHPTQKPLLLLTRAILASTRDSDVILDPFAGSATTGIAANLLGRKFVGIETELQYLKLSKSRRELLPTQSDLWRQKIHDFAFV